MESEHATADLVVASAGRDRQRRSSHLGAVKFWSLASELGSLEPEERRRSDGGTAITQLVFDMARGDLRDDLADVLSLEPVLGWETWTVACYRLGDVVPSQLRDFSSASEAVLATGSCDDPSHIAAELISSSIDGVLWTVLARQGTVTSFEYPVISNLGGTVSSRNMDAAQAAVETWHRRRSAELTSPVGLDEPVEEPSPDPTPSTTDAAVEERTSTGPSEVESVVDLLLARLDKMEALLTVLAGSIVMVQTQIRELEPSSTEERPEPQADAPTPRLVASSQADRRLSEG